MSRRKKPAPTKILHPEFKRLVCGVCRDFLPGDPGFDMPGQPYNCDDSGHHEDPFHCIRRMAEEIRSLRQDVESMGLDVKRLDEDKYR
jgi:hypothetical protein